MDIKVEYNGSYPNLCRGDLVVIIDDVRYQFPDYCLSSGGAVYFDKSWNAEVEYGAWNIGEWPENFPEHFKPAVLSAVNESIPYGCCGGCI